MSDSLLHEILSALERAADPARARADAAWHEVDGYVSLGIGAPRFRKAIAPFRARLRALSKDAALDLADRFVALEIEEPAHVGVEVYRTQLGRFDASDLDRLDRVFEHVRSWSTTDDFCVGVLGPLLMGPLQDPTLRLLTRWNASPNLWKRRASVAAFVRKVGASGRFTEPALTLCERLLDDPEDLVRKAVGWALKDLRRGDPERVLAYVEELRRRGVSSTITLYALRGLEPARRAAILGKRPVLDNPDAGLPSSSNPSEEETGSMDYKEGMWCHVEIPVKDFDRAQRFYGDLFGWTFQHHPDMDYTTYQTPSGVGGGMMALPPGVPQQLTNYILVDDLDRMVMRIETHGGKIVQERFAVGDIGWIAIAADPEGNVIGLWQPNMAAQKQPAGKKTAAKKSPAAKKAPASKKKAPAKKPVPKKPAAKKKPAPAKKKAGRK